jgi:HlyD family secretion protein
MAGTEMLRIANLDRMEVSVDVNENDIIRISKYDSVIIEVDAYAYQEEKFKGVVTSIANSANSTLNTSNGVTEFEVKILILKESYKHLLKPGQPSPFRPGMTASVEIITESKEDILAVPLSAVTVRKESDLDDDSDSGKKKKNKKSNKDKDEKLIEIVFVAVDGEAEVRRVETGINGIDYMEITKGLQLGEKVITGPYLEVSKKLDDGDKIREDERDDEEED